MNLRADLVQVVTTPLIILHLCDGELLLFTPPCINISPLFSTVDVSNADLFVQTKHEAQDFLLSTRRKRGTESTDVVEECCVETCRTEELHEYC